MTRQMRNRKPKRRPILCQPRRRTTRADICRIRTSALWDPRHSVTRPLPCEEGIRHKSVHRQALSWQHHLQAGATRPEIRVEAAQEIHRAVHDGERTKLVWHSGGKTTHQSKKISSPPLLHHLSEQTTSNYLDIYIINIHNNNFTDVVHFSEWR